MMVDKYDPSYCSIARSEDPTPLDFKRTYYVFEKFPPEVTKVYETTQQAFPIHKWKSQLLLRMFFS